MQITGKVLLLFGLCICIEGIFEPFTKHSAVVFFTVYKTNLFVRLSDERDAHSVSFLPWQWYVQSHRKER